MRDEVVATHPAAESDSPGLGARAIEAARWLGPWVSLGVLALWTSSPDGRWLPLAALGLVAALWRPRGRGWWSFAGPTVLAAALLVASFADRRVDQVLDDFDAYWAERDTVVGRLLGQQLDRRLSSGLDATAQLVAAWASSSGAIDESYMRDLRGRCECSALALYDPDGNLLIWDGVHRGMVPERVQSGEQQHSYQDLPLFGYLYVTSAARDGSVAMAAHLLRATLPESLGADLGDFAAGFYRDTGERIRVTAEDPDPGEEIVWDLQGADRLLSVVVDRPDPVERAAQIEDRASTSVGLILLVAWVVLALGAKANVGPRTHGARGYPAAATTLLLLAAVLPLGRETPLAPLFDSGTFSLPAPVPLALGRFALLAVVAFALASVLPRPRVSWPAWVGGLGVAVAFPATLAWISGGVAPAFLAASGPTWTVYQIGVAALLSLVVGVAIALSRPGSGSPWAAPAATLVSLGLAAGGASLVWATSSLSPWWTALWAVPAVLAAVGTWAWDGWRRSVVTCGLAVTLGSTAAIPTAWGERVQARMQVGEDRLAALAAPNDPELEGALIRFGVLADSLHDAGGQDVSLLYQGWRLSGLADLGQPVWLQIWDRDGSPLEGLRMGVSGGEPAALGEALMESWLRGGVRLSQPNGDDARYILTTRLANDDVASVVAPPFVEGSQATGLGPLFQGMTAEAEEPLTVIPLLPGETHEVEDLSWTRTASGWLAEVTLRFSDGSAYHAHYLVTLPGPGIATARASLLLALNLALFMGFWLVGQGLVRDVSPRSLRLGGGMISFRARVTLALFGFFTIANALFGTIAYRTLSQATRRSAQVIAERVGEDAAGWYRALGASMERLASQVGAELLEYRNGELVEGSVVELVELGLHEGWTPYPTHQRLGGREEVVELTETSLGRWEYVTSYRRLPNGDILAAQVPLEAGTTALQATDLVELLGFVVLVGALLSAGLAMLAGRALTRPILALQVASERVGSGDLAPRLPSDRRDEFAAVFKAFNRMVGRVRRARRQLVRTSRRTQLIMDEAAVGMVALDSAGRVTLVNPRARELLGGGVNVGAGLPEDGPLGEALAPWLTEFLEGSREQADGELQAGGYRRVRVRARRLGSLGKGRGVVVAIDDVTDELRAERVLAWGEMARQVAHEVKNPLTPIKLSIQHVRRAWDDRHPEFEDILIRNADAMLAEIDRLAGIAQSFSRFGAPGESSAPLAAVGVSDVVTEVMALYGSATSTIRFTQDVAPGLPAVVSRAPELKEVLVNLLENARLAGHDGAGVEIVARPGPADTVLVTVVDDGTGIPEDVLPRIFEPQFSTRSTGTGLGLAIVQRLVRSWGGNVTVQSEVGKGTSVTVALRVWPSTDGTG